MLQTVLGAHTRMFPQFKIRWMDHGWISCIPCTASIRHHTYLRPLFHYTLCSRASNCNLSKPNSAVFFALFGSRLLLRLWKGDTYFVLKCFFKYIKKILKYKKYLI